MRPIGGGATPSLTAIFTRRQRSQVRQTSYHPGGNSGVCRNRFVPTITGHDFEAWMANHLTQKQKCGPITILARELSETGSVTIYDRPRRRPVKKISTAKNPHSLAS